MPDRIWITSDDGRTYQVTAQPVNEHSAPVNVGSHTTDHLHLIETHGGHLEIDAGAAAAIDAANPKP